MTLAELLERIDTLPSTRAIYATPRWRASSAAVTLDESDREALAQIEGAMTYLTTVGQAKRVIAERRQLRPDLASDIGFLCDAVIYYARYDELEPMASMASGEIRIALTG
ncbi:MAG: hypothetical protein R3B72_47615 [Polyangiaceae bacterium]